MKRLYEWVIKSNRPKHYLLGVSVGALSDDAYCAGLSGSCAAVLPEAKDKMHGGKFDWVDLGFTLAGVVTGYLIRCAVWGK